MPSMPNDQWMPRSLAQMWSVTIWYPPKPGLNWPAMTTASTRVNRPTRAPTASWKWRATALVGTRATTAAPMAGASTRTVRKGKWEVGHQPHHNRVSMKASTSTVPRTMPRT